MIIRKFILLATLAVVGACQGNIGIDTLVTPVEGAKGYLCMRMSNNSQNIIRTLATDDGSPEESKTNSLIALLFKNNVCIDVVKITGGVVGNSNASATPSDVLEVDARATHAFVVANPENAAWDELKIDFSAADLVAEKSKVVGKSWDEINRIVKLAASDISTDNHFMMANAGSYTNGALVGITVVTAGSGMSDQQAIAEAKQKAASINIDRLCSKITLEVSGSLTVTPLGASFTFGGWELNVTNKSTQLYSALEPLTDPDASGDYRRDGNFDLSKFPGIEKESATRTDAERSALSKALRQEFNFLLNGGGSQLVTSPVVRAKGSSAYALENTMEAAAQKKGVTTSVMLKAQYTPNDIVAAGETNYFMYDFRYYTLSQIKQAYKDAIAADRNAGLGKDLPVFLRSAKIPGVETANTNALMDAFVEALTGASFNAESGILGRYQTVQYFHNSVCYYGILVRHDQGIATEMALGRYGVVRNNWYMITVKSVSAPGTPWIPDPSDPANPADPTDPTRPTDPDLPTDPGTNDDGDAARLSVSITVRPWTAWSYEVDI